MTPHRRAFTLIELLVVLVIIALVSAATLPTILPAINHRQISESARLVQATIEGARDQAVRANAPRGIRLMPDPTFTGRDGLPLAYNRMMPIEPAPDYGEGKVSILPGANPPAAKISIPYSSPAAPYPASALRIEESRVDGMGLPNARTTWAWNVRVGDRIRIGTAGRLYSIVGPMKVLPADGNPEKFINYLDPNKQGEPPPMARDGRDVEFLYVVNNQDDDGDGSTDEGWDGSGWDGIDTDGINGVDDAGEWERESWTGPEAGSVVLDQPYTIKRRPVPTQGARVVELPSNVVIDASAWDTTQERSRLPIDPDSLYADIMITPSGTTVPTPYVPGRPIYGGAPFFHFWLAERGDVQAPVVTPKVPHQLPMPDGVVAGAATVLKGERRLVTVNWKTGNVVTNALETFSPTDVNVPYGEAQNGIRETQ